MTIKVSLTFAYHNKMDFLILEIPSTVLPRIFWQISWIAVCLILYFFEWALSFFFRFFLDRSQSSEAWAYRMSRSMTFSGFTFCRWVSQGLDEDHNFREMGHSSFFSQSGWEINLHLGVMCSRSRFEAANKLTFKLKQLSCLFTNYSMLWMKSLIRVVNLAVLILTSSWEKYVALCLVNIQPTSTFTSELLHFPVCSWWASCVQRVHHSDLKFPAPTISVEVSRGHLVRMPVSCIPFFPDMLGMTDWESGVSEPTSWRDYVSHLPWDFFFFLMEFACMRWRYLLLHFHLALSPGAIKHSTPLPFVSWAHKSATTVYCFFIAFPTISTFITEKLNYSMYLFSCLLGIVLFSGQSCVFCACFMGAVCVSLWTSVYFYLCGP